MLDEGADWVDTAEAARVLGKRANTLEHWRSEGRGPRYYRIARAVRYKRADLEAWQGRQVRLVIPEGPDPGSVGGAQAGGKR